MVHYLLPINCRNFISKMSTFSTCYHGFSAVGMVVVALQLAAGHVAFYPSVLIYLVHPLSFLKGVITAATCKLTLSQLPTLIITNEEM